MRHEVPSILVGDPVFHTVLSFFQRSGVCPLFPAEKTSVKITQRIPVKGTAYWQKLIEKPCSSDLIKTTGYILTDSGLFPLHKIRFFAAFDNKTFKRFLFLLLVEALAVYNC